MPEALHRKLKAVAKKRGYSKERAGAYIYGTLHNVEEAMKKKRKEVS